MYGRIANILMINFALEELNEKGRIGIHNNFGGPRPILEKKRRCILNSALTIAVPQH